MTRRQFLLITAMGILIFPKPSRGIFGIGDVVLDPANLAQNTLTAARTLLSNQQEARIILQNVQQLAQDAQHLVSLPLSLVNEINEAMLAYGQTLQHGRGMVGEIQWTVQQYEQLFSAGWHGNGNLMQHAQAMLGKVREAGRLATRTGHMYDRLTGQQQTVNRLLVTSQASPGSLAAQQATNQLLGTLANQQGNIQLLLAAQNEMETSWIMSQVVAAERAAADGARQTIDAAKYQTLGAGLGKGPRLP